YHFNPLIEGINGEKYPSASWFVNDYLGNPVNINAVLGAVGDQGVRLKKMKDIYKVIDDLIGKMGVSFDDILRMTELIDSNYKIGDRNGVLEAPFLLLKNDPKSILEHSKWRKNLEKLEENTEKEISKPPTHVEGNILIWEINIPYNITSTVTKRLAWKNKDSIVMVVNRGWFRDRDQVYIRSADNLFNSDEIINFAKSLGYSAGGKKEVVGAVVPKGETGKFLELMLARLGANR
ncbi:MAG: hypothetical protein QXO71_08420, partial [Candidatus Jordarchaeaceae archaeon]